jgi:hypothetical protein
VATTATPARIDDARTYVAWTSFMAPQGDVAKGEKRRGSDLVVQANPSMWVPADTPQTEWPSEFTAGIEMLERQQRAEQAEQRKRFEDEAATNEIKLDVHLVKATSNIICTYAGKPTTVLKGSVVLASSELAADFSSDFAPVR